MTPSHGGMAEWFKATVLKTVEPKRLRGFESLSLRHQRSGRRIEAADSPHAMTVHLLHYSPETFWL